MSILTRRVLLSRVQPHRHSPPTSLIVLQWLMVVGVLAFGLYLLYRLRLLHALIAADFTFISQGILGVFIVMTLYCGYRALLLGQEHQALIDIRQSGGALDTQPPSLVKDYLTSVRDSGTTAATSQEHSHLMAEVVSERARGSHEFGWFVCGAMIKLGLIGTIIGFVSMLSSVGAIETFDISNMQDVLQNMSAGMGVALYTTLTGVAASMALGLQFLLLDRCADQLVALVIEQGATAQDVPAADR